MRQHPVEIREVLCSAFQFGGEPVAGMIGDLHVETARSLRHGSANSPHPKNAQSFSGNTHTQKIALTDAISPTLAHNAIIFVSAPCGGEQHHEGVVGGTFRQYAGSIRYDQP